jgi:hypothetical protein
MSEGGGLFTRPTTDRERRARQLRAHRVLGDLLDLGQQRGLPVLSWRVSEFALFGEPSQPGGEARRAAFEAWAEALELVQHAPVHSSGFTSWRASVPDWGGRRVDVGLIATVYDDDEDGC